MSAFTLQLPAGTNRTELINFPECGSWVGAVGFSLSSLTQVDISELLVMFYTGGSTNWIRRVGGNQANDWKNWSLVGGRRIWFPFLTREQMVKITYTSTSVVSLCYETNRNVQPLVNPFQTGIPFNNEVYGYQYQA